ncbi:hypothetical protein E2I00_011312, partial [Balaenoptera physalus]
EHRERHERTPGGPTHCGDQSNSELQSDGSQAPGRGPAALPERGMLLEPPVPPAARVHEQGGEFLHHTGPAETSTLRRRQV